MKAGLIMELIKSRMDILHPGGTYELRHRHFALKPNSEFRFTLPSGNLLFLVDPVAPDTSITSEGGDYYYDGVLTVELQHQHWGEILLGNQNADNRADIQFIQMIPQQ